MASRPAKRQKRGTTVLSDEEADHETEDRHLPLRTPKKQIQLELGASNGSPLTLSPSPVKPQLKAVSPKTTPKKSRKTGQKTETTNNKRLSTFFGTATEEQRWHRKSTTPEVDAIGGEDSDAIIDEDLSDDALLGVEDENSHTTKNPLDRRKDIVKGDINPALKPNGVIPFPGQRFIKPSIPAKRPSTDANGTQTDYADGTHRPWADRYGPTNLDELGVHKKKVQDVQKWLGDALSGKSRQRLLLLKGPAGSGKTTTVSLLSQTLSFQTISWQNPVAYEAATTGSVAVQFEDFLNRGGQFGSLSFSTDLGHVQPSASPVLLVEEFPTAMTMSSGSDSFRSIILRFLARSSALSAAPFPIQQAMMDPPLIMVVSETLLSSSTAFSDSFTAHRLFGSEILNHSSVTVVEFNPVAPTFIFKALDLVMKKEARESKRRRMPGSAVIQYLAEMGDIRNAVNTLEFLCVRDTEADWSGTIATKSKRSKDATSMTEMEKNTLKLVSQRETALNMFHAAGKIMYNKREDARIVGGNAEPPPKPPDHLIQFYSPKMSQVDIEALLNETGTDIQTFVSTLHENYVLSCNGESFLDSLDACSEVLSISDVLNPEPHRQIRSKSGTTTALQANISFSSSDALRQDEISFNIATRGLLFSLPYPVNRAASASGRKAGSNPMFYPTSLRLWRPTEEIRSLVSLFTTSNEEGRSKDSYDGVAAWKSSSFGFTRESSTISEEVLHVRKMQPTTDELTLEILPFMNLMWHARKQDIKKLDKITKFHGTNVPMPMLGDDPEDEEPKDEIIVRAEKVNTTAILMKAKEKPRLAEKDSVSDMDMQMLYLEDDDIVDD